jgi:hypothetical protein
MAAKNVTLDDLVNSLDPEIRRLLYEDTRTLLNQRPTILDITYNSLRVNNRKNYSEQIFKEIHDTLLSVVGEKAQRTYNSITDIPRGYFQGSTPYLIYINGGPEQQFLIAKSVAGIRTFVTDKISKDPRLVNSIFGLRKVEKELMRKGIPTGDVQVTYVSKLDIGHIATEGDLSSLLTSPLSYKAQGILEYGVLTGNAALEKYASEALDKLYAIQADVKYTFKNTTPQALKTAESKLGEVFVVVTLHTSDLNQEFSDIEKTIFNNLRQKIALLASSALRNKYLIQNIKGSNTIVQDIEQSIVEQIRTGKAKLSSHSTNTKKTAKKQVNKNKITATAKNIVTKSTSPKKAAPISLVNLQTFINLYLQSVISANMGDGSRKNILNYRTGRFAASAKVERLTQSREGMVTAFYNYMRNPYGTFSDGGRQEIPKSRDPKLLISKSIKEIAETIVGNRMRAILI